MSRIDKFGRKGIWSYRILNDSIYQKHSRQKIRQLLQHEGGWDRNLPVIRCSMHITLLFQWVFHPGDPVTTVRYMLENRMLDFTPGTQSQYSNFGFCVWEG